MGDAAGWCPVDSWTTAGLCVWTQNLFPLLMTLCGSTARLLNQQLHLLLKMSCFFVDGICHALTVVAVAAAAVGGGGSYQCYCGGGGGEHAARKE